ncbi:MAG: 3'-5' exonuclease [Spirochaetia bacterium]|nr:3'-5' exonuclease [Spirochaetia bacterium]
MFSIQKIKTLDRFVAIDFETANKYKNSACAVGLIKVDQGKIIERKSILIRPVSTFFEFTYIHGITWEDVKSEPTYKELWPQILNFIEDAEFLAAHNASFDKKVMKVCCQEYGLQYPDIPFICTVKLSRDVWQLFPTKLPDVCKFLNLTLKHHDPLSDAEACANIVISAIKSNEKF